MPRTQLWYTLSYGDFRRIKRVGEPVPAKLRLNSNTIRRWCPCNLSLMCFYCTVNSIEKPCESCEINLRGIFPNVLR